MTQYEEITLDRILDPEEPMRTDLTPESVDDLVQSIKKVGIIEPLIVKKSGDNFEVIAGHRRRVAAKVAGLSVIPCVVRDEKGLEAEIIKVHENLARAEINPIDWAKHLTTLKQQYELSTAKIAEILGMSPAWVGQHLDILDYPAEIYQAVENGKLSFSAARELAQIKDETKRKIYANSAIKGGITPALAAQWRREANTPNYQPPQTQNDISTVETSEQIALQTPICPVCKTDILPEEQTTITVHISCLPN